MSPRLARIKEKTLWWQFTIIHTPGKLQMAADALSRRKGATIYKVSVHDTADEELGVMEDMKPRYEPLVSNTISGAAVNYVMNNDEVSVVTWDKLKSTAEEDSTMVKLMEVVTRGFPQNSYDLETR